jgi:hypothetical protein
MLVYFMAIWYILRPIGKVDGHLVHIVVIWYIFSHFDMLYQEKSGNPGWANVLIIMKNAHVLKYVHMCPLDSNLRF